jgi:hypothetical protein
MGIANMSGHKKNKNPISKLKLWYGRLLLPEFHLIAKRTNKREYTTPIHKIAKNTWCRHLNGTFQKKEHSITITRVEKGNTYIGLK